MYSKEISRKIEEIEKKFIVAIALMGSYSRNEEGDYSDIDIVCFTTEKDKEPAISIVDNKLLVISYANIEEVNEWFTNPKFIVELISGVRNLRPIWDPSNYLANIKEKAIDFKWNRDIQSTANIHTRKELISLIEEVHKGIQGNISNDIGRQLNCIFGMSFGLFKIISIQKGIILKGDNALFNQVTQIYKDQSKVQQMINSVFGIASTPINERVKHGLEFYKVVSNEFMEIFKKEEKGMILKTIKNIDQHLE